MMVRGTCIKNVSKTILINQALMRVLMLTPKSNNVTFFDFSLSSCHFHSAWLANYIYHGGLCFVELSIYKSMIETLLKITNSNYIMMMYGNCK